MAPGVEEPLEYLHQWQRRRESEGIAHFDFSATEGGGGGESPRLRGGGARRVDFADSVEGGADGGGERAEDVGMSVVEGCVEIGFGAVAGDRGHGDGEGTGGEIARARPVFGDGEQGGTRERGRAGEIAEGAGDAGR